MIRFQPVAQITDPLNVTLGLCGASGTGKTFSALRMARGMSEGAAGQKGAPFLYADTENRRALHYRQDFPEMMHHDFTALDDAGKMRGFGPERWIELIDAIEEHAKTTGARSAILDSFSHAWEGIDGVLDRQAVALDRLVAAAQARAGNGREVNPDSFNQLSWAEVKPGYRRLIDRIVRCKVNLIICSRAKPVMQKGFGQNATNARPTKTRLANVPWDIAGDGDLIFEMTAMFMLDPKSPGCPVHQIKLADQFRALFARDKPLDEETGRKMGEWARNQGDGAEQKRILDLARTAAREGTAAFTRFWQENKQHRPLVNTIIEDCQTLAKAADKAATADDSKPFGAAEPERDEAAIAAAEAEFKAQRARELKEAEES